MKRKNLLKSIGIVLIVMQAIAIFGSIIGKDFDIFFVHNAGELISLIVFMLPLIIGTFLIFLSCKKN